MTPKQFFDTSGTPFATTRLDDLSGIEQQRHAYAYRMAEPGEEVERLPAPLFGTIKAKAEAGAERMAESKFREAFNLFTEAIALLPEPQTQWNAAGWLLVALGENAVRAGKFQSALRPLQDAMGCPGTIGNPWVHLRLGQVHFELRELLPAADQLARAYMGGGREIFADQDPKYFALVEAVPDPPPGMDRLP